ncbi:lytic transglycosylase domain-containing protein [Ferrimonas kyonanensis]|uniref:lytic transglycosylase domain-containing protein n=1 Tax=Ferrimonas kyonanensis TaxID=364763 RepID=UPI000687F434|nr:lytic transglycosylase domain-containing protein [Ferrimonas kyonanensis]
MNIAPSAISTMVIMATLQVAMVMPAPDSLIPDVSPGRHTISVHKLSSSPIPTLAQAAQPLSTSLQKAYHLDQYEANRYAGYLIEAADYTGINPLVMAALVHTESRYQDHAVSSVGAMGPAQIMMRYWQEECPKAAVDPRENVICGASILAQYHQQYCLDVADDIACALHLYNVGPGRMDRQPLQAMQEALSYSRLVVRSLEDLLPHAGLFASRYQPLTELRF